jgi:ABC-2 type transport system permease protein
MNSTAMDRLPTLMKREWLQHRTGWLVLMGLPAAAMLVLGLFDGHGVQISVNGDDRSIAAINGLPAPLQTVGWSVATMAATFVLAALAVLAQLPGLARRDVQDRSIEFWRSLPTSHVQNVAALLLMHLLVLPGLALMVAMVAGQLVALVAIASQQGPMAWLQQSWWTLLPALLAVTARALLGLLLAVAWLSPLLLLTMAASAWLKRWALPVVVVVTLLGVQWLDPRLPMPVVKPSLDRIGQEAVDALLAIQAFKGADFEVPSDLVAALPQLAAMLWRDAAQLLGNAASPAFIAALAVAALGFGLLVLRRQSAS